MRSLLAPSAASGFITPSWMNLVFARPVSLMNPQLDLNLIPEKPGEIITHTSDEFYDLCARADQLQLVDGRWTITQRGEFALETWSCLPGQNSGYKVRVRWH